MQAIIPFKVKVKRPLRKIEEGGLNVDDTVIVRAITQEHRLDGRYIIFFLVWNANAKNFMMEEACQFEPEEK